MAKIKGARANTLGRRIIVLLQQRKDVKRLMLPGLLNSTEETVNMTLGKLRKAGYKIFPMKGAGTPLRIAETLNESKKYLDWRRKMYLSTAKRMVATEYKMGEEFPELSGRGPELLLQIKESTNTNNAI